MDEGAFNAGHEANRSDSYLNRNDYYRHVPKKPQINYDNLSKEEAQKTFHGMLSDLGVGITWKWEDVNRVI